LARVDKRWPSVRFYGIAFLMFFIFLAISARKADRLQTAAKERAGSRGTRGTVNRREEGEELNGSGC
jgi:hypothetical protein